MSLPKTCQLTWNICSLPGKNITQLHVTLSSKHKQRMRAYFFCKREYCKFLKPFLISWFLSTLKRFQYFCFPFQQIKEAFSLALNSDNWSSLLEKKSIFLKGGFSDISKSMTVSHQSPPSSWWLHLLINIWLWEE